MTDFTCGPAIHVQCRFHKRWLLLGEEATVDGAFQARQLRNRACSAAFPIFSVPLPAFSAQESLVSPAGAEKSVPASPQQAEAFAAVESAESALSRDDCLGAALPVASPQVLVLEASSRDDYLELVSPYDLAAQRAEQSVGGGRLVDLRAVADSSASAPPVASPQVLVLEASPLEDYLELVSPYDSAAQRVEHSVRGGQLVDLRAVADSSASAPPAASSPV